MQKNGNISRIENVKIWKSEKSGSLTGAQLVASTGTTYPNIIGNNSCKKPKYHRKRFPPSTETSSKQRKHDPGKLPIPLLHLRPFLFSFFGGIQLFQNKQ